MQRAQQEPRPSSNQPGAESEAALAAEEDRIGEVAFVLHYRKQYRRQSFIQDLDALPTPD